MLVIHSLSDCGIVQGLAIELKECTSLRTRSKNLGVCQVQGKNYKKLKKHKSTSKAG